MKTCQALVALILAAGVAQANVFNFSATLNGAAEIAPVNTPATGSALFTYDSTLHTLQFSVSFSGLIGNTTAAHIHAGVNAAGVGNNGVATQTPSFVGFPQGVTSGTYTSPTFDLTLASSWNPGYVTANGGTIAGAEAALVSAMNSNRAYLNIHTTTFTGGEIRGYITPVTAVPEPATTVAVGGGLLGAFALVRRVRASRK